MAERNLKIAIFGRMFRAKYERFPRFFRHRVQDLNVISPPVKKKSRLASIRPISSSSNFTKKLFYLQEREKLLFETLRPISILLSCLGRGQFFTSPIWFLILPREIHEFSKIWRRSHLEMFMKIVKIDSKRVKWRRSPLEIFMFLS